MKKRMLLTVVLAVLLLCSALFPAAAAERFTDVPADAWYVSYVDYAVEHGIFNGISATQFAPGKTMNRAQFVQVLANLSEIDTTDTNVTTPFSDVPAGKWFSPAVKWAYENGIVNGKGGGKFAPGDNVNRQEMCTMLARYADHLGVRLTKTAEKTVFADDASISSWAKDAVYACQQTELINGIGGNKFNPKGTTPRSQGATLFARFHQYLNSDPGINPLLVENKPINKRISPSFNIDTTGFVKNYVGLADLKGKTLTMVTPVKYGVFNYYGPNGEYLSEWDWFEGLKEEYGLNIKYIESQYMSAIGQILTYMNAGKTLDVVPTHRGGLPLYLNLSRPLDPYINIQNMKNSPGVSAITLEQTRYGGGYRCISPVGTVDVLWYDQSRVEEFGLQDPHKLWQQDRWDWNAWRSFISSVPPTRFDGTKLAAFTSNDPLALTVTDSIHSIQLDSQSATMNILNNWMDERVLRAVTYYESAYKSIQNGTDLGLDGRNVFMVGDVMMGNTVVLMNNYDQVDSYAQVHKVNWVPYPKSPYETGRYAAINFGYTMMLPKIMKNESNAPYAVKFMELWATRFTEAMVDHLSTAKYLRFDHKQKNEYFQFCMENTYFSISSINEWKGLGLDIEEAMRAPNTGYLNSFSNRNLNVATEHIKVANVVQKAIDYAVGFAQ